VIGNFQLPQIPKPAWYHGVHPASKLASTVRDAWFAFLGDLNGFPYSSGLVSVNVAIDFTVTDFNGNPLAGARLTVSVLDTNTKQLLGQQSGTTDANGDLPVELGSITDPANAEVFVIWEATWNGYTALDRLDGQTLGSIEKLGIPVKIYTGSGSGNETKASFILQGSCYPDGTDPAVNAAVTVTLAGQSANANTNAQGVYAATLGSFQFDPASTYPVTITVGGQSYTAQISGKKIQSSDGVILDVSAGKAYVL
jgi:hypothetical protein